MQEDEETPATSRPATWDYTMVLDDDQAFLRLPVDGVQTFFVLHSVYVAFTDGRRLVSTQPFNRWFNKTVIYLKGHYTHSELAFKFVSIDNQKEIFAACEIRAGEELHWKWKTMNYASKIWELRRLSITADQRHQLLRSCVYDVRRGVGFNGYVYVNFFLPQWLKRDRCGKKVWCSEHVSRKLKEIGVEAFRRVEPCAMDPLELYNKVVQICDTVAVHPLHMTEVLKKGMTLPEDD